MAKVFLAHMGSPENRREIYPYLRSIFTDRSLMRLPLQPVAGRIIAALRAGRSAAHYEAAGWSPLNGLTRSLAQKVSALSGAAVHPLFTHARQLPPLPEAGDLIVPLYPQYSTSLAGAIVNKYPECRVAAGFHSRPDFIALMKEKTLAAAAGAPGKKPALMFIAHSVPLAATRRGDPYIKNVEETYALLSAHFKGYEHSLSYIGKAGPLKWHGPEAGQEIKRLKGKEAVVAVYISFPADNIEALYDIDIEHGRLAKTAGIGSFTRAPLLNDGDGFARMIAALIKENL